MNAGTLKAKACHAPPTDTSPKGDARGGASVGALEVGEAAQSDATYVK